MNDIKIPRNARNVFHIFNLIGTLMMGFLTGESWCILKSWCKGGQPEKGFQCCFADGLKQMFTFLLWRRLRLSLRTNCFSLWFSLPIAEPFSPGNFEEIILLKFHKSTAARSCTSSKRTSKFHLIANKSSNIYLPFLFCLIWWKTLITSRILLGYSSIFAARNMLAIA